MKKIVLVTDVWLSNINGVVTSLIKTKEGLETAGFEVATIHPGQFKTIPMPTYPEIKLAITSIKKIRNILIKEKPDYVHIATEGSLGLAARTACRKNQWNFTSFYHTRLPDYVYTRLKIFRELTYKYLRWFHSKSSRIFVPVASLKKELEVRNFHNLAVVPYGVDTDFFKNNPLSIYKNLSKPIFVFLGRLAPEKNLKAFLECRLPGSKLVIGDGPDRNKLESEYKNNVRFVGYKTGPELVELLSASSVFVFPSKTDTVGIAILEALACGLPVAAYDVPGPQDIITQGIDGFLGDDLETNAVKCLTLNAENCRKKALAFSWQRSIDSFIENLAPIR